MSQFTQYVLHEHIAVKAGPHYDFRIKFPRANKLMSFAIPKSKIPTQTKEFVLAIRTEDHDVSWLDFQGEIPKGSYGYGMVRTLQKGEAEILSWYETRVISFKVSGLAMNGKYNLIKKQTQDPKDKQEIWWLTKGK